MAAQRCLTNNLLSWIVTTLDPNHSLYCIQRHSSYLFKDLCIYKQPWGVYEVFRFLLCFCVFAFLYCINLEHPRSSRALKMQIDEMNVFEFILLKFDLQGHILN